MTHKEALTLALEALKRITHRFDLESVTEDATKAITAAEEALAQPEQEPVAWMEGESVYWHTNPSLNDWIRANGTPLYTTPPQRKPLTDTERDSMVDSYDSGLMEKFWYLKGIDDTEAAHGIKE